MRQGAALIRRIVQTPGSSNTSIICTYYVDSKHYLFTHSKLFLDFRQTANSIGHDKIGFYSHEIGTHFIRIGSSLEMFMENAPVF